MGFAPRIQGLANKLLLGEDLVPPTGRSVRWCVTRGVNQFLGFVFEPFSVNSFPDLSMVHLGIRNGPWDSPEQTPQTRGLAKFPMSSGNRGLSVAYLSGALLFEGCPKWCELFPQMGANKHESDANMVSPSNRAA